MASTQSAIRYDLDRDVRTVEQMAARLTPYIYENELYGLMPGDLPKVLEAWAKAVPIREKLSPLAACMTSELGGLNKFVHIWPYKDSNERTRIREESRKGGQWPPQSGVRPIRQENKLLIPASFSPLQ